MSRTNDNNGFWRTLSEGFRVLTCRQWQAPWRRGKSC